MSAPSRRGGLPDGFRRTLGWALVVLGLVLLGVRAVQWADLIGDGIPMPGTRYTRSLTDVAAVALVGFGVPVIAGWRRESMSERVEVGPLRLPRWAIGPGVAVGTFAVAVIVLVAARP